MPSVQGQGSAWSWFVQVRQCAMSRSGMWTLVKIPWEPQTCLELWKSGLLESRKRRLCIDALVLTGLWSLGPFPILVSEIQGRDSGPLLEMRIWFREGSPGRPWAASFQTLPCSLCFHHTSFLAGLQLAKLNFAPAPPLPSVWNILSPPPTPSTQISTSFTPSLHLALVQCHLFRESSRPEKPHFPHSFSYLHPLL